MLADLLPDDILLAHVGAADGHAHDSSPDFSELLGLVSDGSAASYAIWAVLALLVLSILFGGGRRRRRRRRGSTHHDDSDGDSGCGSGCGGGD